MPTLTGLYNVTPALNAYSGKRSRTDILFLVAIWLPASLKRTVGHNALAAICLGEGNK